MLLPLVQMDLAIGTAIDEAGADERVENVNSTRVDAAGDGDIVSAVPRQVPIRRVVVCPAPEAHDGREPASVASEQHVELPHLRMVRERGVKFQPGHYAASFGTRHSQQVPESRTPVGGVV